MQQAVCVRRKENKSKKQKIEKSRPTENTPRNPHQPSDRDHLETAREKPRPTRYSPASIDTGFVEIGLVQLSQSVKTTNSTSHTRTHIPTDKLNNGTPYAPLYEEAFLPLDKKGLGRFAPSASPHYESCFFVFSRFKFTGARVLVYTTAVCSTSMLYALPGILEVGL